MACAAWRRAGFEAPGVVVSFTQDSGLHSGAAFAAQGLQTAAGVPLQCDEGAEFKTFRIGLFGLDKLHDPDSAVTALSRALSVVAPKPATTVSDLQARLGQVTVFQAICRGQLGLISEHPPARARPLQGAATPLSGRFARFQGHQDRGFH